MLLNDILKYPFPEPPGKQIPNSQTVSRLFTGRYPRP